jgi:hypothetical protein
VLLEFSIQVVTTLDMAMRHTLVTCTAIVLLVVVGSSSVSADESVPVTSSTTVIEQFDDETGIIWSQIDETTIEVRLPG